MGKLRFLWAVCLTALLLFGSCNAKESDGSQEGPLRVALLINGNLGDKSFHDSANNGMAMIREQLGCQTTVVEVGYDDSKWEPAFRDLCDEKYDILICGTWQMQEIVTKVALDYPDQKIIVYDTSMDYAADTQGNYKNIYSIEYKQNEGSYLAGVLAAGMSQTGVIGFVGGMDNTVIRDFLVGYIQGAKDLNPAIKVIPSFVGNFSDTAKAKELTFAQYQMRADVVFSCASNAGEGALQAAKERSRLIIGVDSDQAMLYQETDPVLANLIMSSMLKRVDQSLFLSVQAALLDNLAWGSRVVLGINEECVGLADNPIYQRVVSPEVRQVVDDYTGRIRRGEIQVVTAFGMDQPAFTNFINQVRP
ncbi:MAG: BMP family ABC transporter substrate-binding protein [Spirochaetales bacterium]|jgi:basic membrane protein A|nr:BMP family ABC transporter substrate-binding protein [Spirochaetales bacterium]